MHPFLKRSETTRRQFLTSTASGLGAAALLSLLQRNASAAAKPPHFAPKAKSCIFIFLAGGTSQLELFDPKPTLAKLDKQQIPESFRKGVRLGQTKWDAPLMASRTGFKKYGQCGMELSDLLPHIGGVADEITLIRSMHHEAFDHAPGELEILTGKDTPGRPTFGAWLSYGLGNESDDLPAYVVMINHRGPKARALTWGSGFLPAAHQGMLLRNEGQPILNLKTPDGISRDLHRAQLDAIAGLNELHREATGDENITAKIAAYELAYRMQSAAPELIDLKGETEATLKAYGVNREGEEGSFARNLLLARRMVERGVRYVTLMQANWDHHDHLAEDLPKRCREVDQPIAALIRDLKQRGLLGSTLVVWGTEFGRTAITQGSWDTAGRDHHPHAFSLWLAGGGAKGGQVIGATDELAWRVTDSPVHTHDFHATLLHLFGLDHTKLTFKRQGLDMRLTDVAGKVVEKVFR
jgi:uncharacterized protein (DUF1501 family)